VIPGNDDALRAIRLFAGSIADAVLAGRGLRESRAAESAAAQKTAVPAAEDEAGRRRPKARPVAVPAPMA
jgi:small subunit ribosomal protein S2